MPKFITRFVFNPLIWTGFILSYITLRQTPNSEDIILMLKEPKYYIWLFIGAVIYVWRFEKHYTKKREKVALLPNIVAVVDTMFTVFLAWLCLTLGVLYFQYRGERISRQLRIKYNEQRIANENAPVPTGMIRDAGSIMQGINVEVGQRYMLTIHAPNSISLEKVAIE